MPGPLTTPELMQLIGGDGPFAPGAIVRGDEMIETATELLRHNAHPEYVTTMVSQSVTQDYLGVDGFAKAWSDWMSPYESFRLEFDDVVALGDKLLFTVRQIATTKHNAVEVETASASVWWLEEGQVRQAAFYLDQQTGMRAAGLDDRPSSD